MSIGRPWLAATAALAAGALLLAGCGGGSGNTSAPPYVQQVDAVANGLNALTNTLYTPTDTAAAASELATMQVALRKASTQLAAITPPPAVRGAHERLVASLSELANEVGPVIEKLKTGNFDGFDGAFALKAAGQARAAIAEIKKAGYPIQIPLLD
jgi:hypothetical protein